MAKYKASTEAEDAAILAELGINLYEEESENVKEAIPTEVGRSEELINNTTNPVDPPPASYIFVRHHALGLIVLRFIFLLAFGSTGPYFITFGT